MCNVLTVLREGKSKLSESTNLDKLNMASAVWLCLCLLGIEAITNKH